MEKKPKLQPIEGIEPRKKKRETEESDRAGTKRGRRGHSYSADRCNDAEIPVEEGVTYYSRTIDTSRARNDVVNILKGKRMI